MNKINAELILYSECEVTNKKIATFVLKVPKFIMPHINSHRALSRNSASSRAVPAKKMRERVMNTPFIPVYFGENKPGMQSGQPLTGFRLFVAKRVWLWSRYIPVFLHFIGEKIRLHKEVLNRIIEAWIMTEIVLTATEWGNFFKLRNNPDAQPDIQVVAKQMDELLNNTKPIILKTGEWHLPFIRPEENNLDVELKKKISSARCARVSYFLFNGKLSDIESDKKICDRLVTSGHWSPLEHVAQATESLERSGNFVGWKQYRKEFENESGGDYHI